MNKLLCLENNKYTQFLINKDYSSNGDQLRYDWESLFFSWFWILIYDNYQYIKTNGGSQVKVVIAKGLNRKARPFGLALQTLYEAVENPRQHNVCSIGRSKHFREKDIVTFIPVFCKVHKDKFVPCLRWYLWQQFHQRSFGHVMQ